MQEPTPAGYPVGAHYAVPSRLDARPTALFVYGTLQFEAVLVGLIGRVPEAQPATALGWRAAALAGRVYPGLVPALGAPASGLLLTSMSEREWRVLDTFEDDRYDLRRLDLSCGSDAWAYVWPDEEVQAEDWDAGEFQDRHLQEYAARCVRIAPELAARAGY
ncbi:gamma-glutamylcyclotransferase family protein [Streptomyces tendae]|uniref:gamma-glutamylcyclotransferase family protein n=1 Tax=Streptomyces tendae TaxID=1932 RepID=UPI0033AFA1B0